MKPYYQAGGVTIYKADALEILPELSGVGAVVTDPPYSSGGAFRSDRTQSTVSKYIQTGSAAVGIMPDFSGDNRDKRAFLLWCSLWLAAARNASKPGAVLCSFIDWRQLPTLTDAAQIAGWVWRNIATWHKPGCRMQKGRFSSSAEYVVYGTNGPALDHDKSPQNVYSCAPVGLEGKEHIAQKPDAVMAWVLSAVPAGSLVLDPFCGSGSTLRAAKMAGLESVGIEMDERFCEIAARRCDQEQPLFGAV